MKQNQFNKIISLAILAILGSSPVFAEDSTIPNLPAGNTIQTGDLGVISRGGVTYKTPLGSAANQPVTAFLQPSNNLSDLANAATARTNLGLGSAATQSANAFAQSISLTAPSALYSSPITFTNTSGAFSGSLSLLTQTANTVLAGPASGSAANPAFRALTGADLPLPSATTLGGMESIATVSHQFLTGLSTSGVPSQAQPAFTDIAGTAQVAQGGTGVTAAQGNGTKVQLSTGSTTTNDCVKFDANGNTVDAGAACGSGGSVSVTAATPNLVVTPSPGTGTFAIGLTDLINAQGTNTPYTIQTTDIGKTVTHNNNSSAVAVTLPAASTTGYTGGSSFSDLYLGSGTETITTGAGTINGNATQLVHKYGWYYPVSDGSNWQAIGFPGFGTITSGAMMKFTSDVSGASTAATAGTDYQAPITLTTTGTSGAATLSANTLNIPNYSGGVSGVSSLNSLTGALNIVAGSNITVTPSGSNITIAASGGGGSGAPILLPSSAYTTDSAANLFPYVYTGQGANAAIHEAGWGVAASLAASPVLELRFQMPPSIPTGTFKLVSYCLANASSGVAKYTPSDAIVAAGSSPSSATLTSDTQVSQTFTSADVYVVNKTALSATPSADGVSVVAVTFNATGWTLASVLSCRWVELWE